MAKPSIDPQLLSLPIPTMELPEPTRCAVRRIELPGPPEDAAVSPDGSVWTGLEDGRIVRIDPDEAVTVVGTLPSRVLGVEWHPDGWLLVCPSDHGVYRVDPSDGAFEPIATEVDGQPLTHTNNAAIASDGTIYVSQSSQRFLLEHWMADVMEASCTGRLLAIRPDGTIDELLGGLAYANGVTLTPDESAVLVAEAVGYAIRRVWLTGPRAGETDRFAEVPAYLDNLSTGPSGTIWAPSPAPRNPLLDLLRPRAPLMRKMIWALPDALQPGPSRRLRVLGFDANGALTHHLDGPADTYHFVTGAREHEGMLWLASINEPAIAVLDLP